MTLISLYGFLRPRPERAEEVRQILTSFVEPTRQEEGNLQYHLAFTSSSMTVS
ncbi:putative quinol monooxygenase [Streptomyces sp. NPDC001668]|uniref:putative quinol monooxygenase n=1 Tax=unclassified Streptomyces TaxID=2593676 RepID=UPI003404AFA5